MDRLVRLSTYTKLLNVFRCGLCFSTLYSFVLYSFGWLNRWLVVVCKTVARDSIVHAQRIVQVGKQPSRSSRKDKVLPPDQYMHKICVIYFYRKILLYFRHLPYSTSRLRDVAAVIAGFESPH